MANVRAQRRWTHLKV